jgi:hypothetical protein
MIQLDECRIGDLVSIASDRTASFHHRHAAPVGAQRTHMDVGDLEFRSRLRGGGDAGERHPERRDRGDAPSSDAV